VIRSWTDEDIADCVRRSTEAQGLPERVEDPQVLARLVVLLGTAETERSA
jgi:hypothetical protein